ncbi:aminoacetone oxidase family FAD-binding enzyme [Tumebacillus algifaecis]|uniref:Aminoacetone oxidase family FAD-binding enzyme n=1 Tax=Tumebacillus algifaecis TaxID=1214604 RepID=A0A223D3Q3_9BACL|nr:NAD(P)/FAD-dependent oxidoreductase [Tumebacillus algifaecis]ASS75984.1 aminoacetone oxidase family FAD-binding enzyme [Tumebacillus algifaecis]
MKYDCIVIGGGPSGLMASISAGMHGAKVLLLEKGDKLGRKLLISGGGRCNVTNNKEIDELIKHIPGNGRFMHGPFSVFNNRDIIRFFEDLGIKLKEEDRGRMFPVSDKAKSVLDALLRKMDELDITIKTNTPVAHVRYENGETVGVTLRGGQKFDSKAVIIAVGGMSVPKTGSTGDGYAWAREAGHTITDLYPTEVPIKSREPWIRDLQGLSLRHIELTVLNAKGKKIIVHEGDMIFTHFGISGPAVLRCSQFVVKELKKGTDQVQLLLDLFPDKTLDEVQKELHRLAELEPKKAFKNVIKGYLPERMIPLFLSRAGLQEDTTFANLPKKPLADLAELIKGLPIHAAGTLSIEEAFITGGGVHLKEVTPSTMQSKLMPGLFFCGEVLDLHGYTGGFNITVAFSTGYVAGKSAAEC